MGSTELVIALAPPTTPPARCQLMSTTESYVGDHFIGGEFSWHCRPNHPASHLQCPATRPMAGQSWHTP